MSRELEIWTLYDHPRDYPNSYVARKFLNDKPTSEFMVSPSLASLRKYFDQKGLLCLNRDPNDDPVIVETWF